MAAAAPGVRRTRLEDKPFASGGTVQIQTQGQLPPGRRVLGVLFRLDLDITQPGAGAAAQLGSVLYQLINNLQVGRRVNISGLGLRFLSWAQRQRMPLFPAGFAATANGVFSRSIAWYLAYQDPSSRSPNDGAIPTELYTDPIIVRFGSNAVFAATAPALGNGVLRTYVYHDGGGAKRNAGIIPPSIQIVSEDWNQLVATVNKQGLWVYALAFREAPNDAGGISSAQVSQFTSSVDGEAVVNNVRSQDAATLFNHERASGTNLETESQTAPLAGEELSDQPGVANGAGQGTTINFLPLLWPSDGYLLSQCPRATIGAKFEMQGTLGAYKLAYRLVEPRPDSAIGAAAVKLGLPTSVFKPKTQSKESLSNPDLARFIPLRVTRT